MNGSKQGATQIFVVDRELVGQPAARLSSQPISKGLGLGVGPPSWQTPDFLVVNRVGIHKYWAPADGERSDSAF